MRLSVLSLSLLFALACPLSGCVAVVVGAAATGGYLLGRDERSLDQISEDAALTTAVKAALLRGSVAQALVIHVDTHKSIVTLTGEVRNAEEYSRAGKIAQDTNGVKAVKNQLRIVGVVVEERS